MYIKLGQPSSVAQMCASIQFICGVPAWGPIYSPEIVNGPILQRINNYREYGINQCKHVLVSPALAQQHAMHMHLSDGHPTPPVPNNKDVNDPAGSVLVMNDCDEGEAEP